MRWSTWLTLLVLALAPAVAWAKKPLVEIDISVDGARVAIDGKVKLPHAGKREHVPLNEGTHSLRVDHPGYATFQKTFDVDSESPESLRVRVDLKGGKPAPAPAAEAEEEKAPPPKPAPKPKVEEEAPPEESGPTPDELAAKQAAAAKKAQEREERRQKRKADLEERARKKAELAAKKKTEQQAADKKEAQEEDEADRRKEETARNNENEGETGPQNPPETPLAPSRTQIEVPARTPASQAPVLSIEPRAWQTPLTVAVLDYAGFDSDARVAGVMSDAIAAEIRKYDRLTAIGSKDIRKLLTKKQLYDLTGCENDRCRALFGASMGVDDVVYTELKQDKDTSRLEMRRIDVKSGLTIAVADSTVEGTGLSPFDGVGPDVHTLYQDYPLRPGQKEGVTRDVVKSRLRPPPPLPTSVFISTATIAGAALLTGGIFALEFSTAQTQYRNVVNSTSEAPISASQLNALAGKMKLDASISNIGLIAGGALTVASIVEIFFTDWKGLSQAAAPPVMQDPGPDDVTFRLTPTGLLVSWK